MLVSVFETAAFCLYSDIFKMKIASKVTKPGADLKTLFFNKVNLQKKMYYYITLLILIIFFSPLCIIYSCLFLYALPLLCELFNNYNFLLLVHSGQVIPNPNKDAKQHIKLFSDFQGKSFRAACYKRCYFSKLSYCISIGPM